VFVSFPKSGRTFVRAMLSSLCHQAYGIPPQELIEFDNFHRRDKRIPIVLFTHDGDAMRQPGEFSADKAAYRGKKVVFLARHPADVAVSRYFHLKHRSRDGARRRLARQPMRDFVWTGRGGVPSIVEFLNGWAAGGRTLPGFALFRYEDFLADPAATLARLAAFLGLPDGPREIAQAVAFASFESLKQKEREGFFNSERLRPRDRSKEESFKVRTGKAGGFRSHFSAEECARLEAFVRDHLDPVFGYSNPAAS
jgi:hypothetical protein